MPSAGSLCVWSDRGEAWERRDGQPMIWPGEGRVVRSGRELGIVSGGRGQVVEWWWYGKVCYQASKIRSRQE